MTEHVFQLATKNASDITEIITLLETMTGLKFAARVPNDTVHGHITIVDNTVYITVYDMDEAPTSGRKTTLKKPDTPVNKLTIDSYLREAGMI